MTVAKLSRIWLNPLRKQARHLLGNPQAMHAAVLGGLPSQPVTERVLWRVDADEPRRPGLLVLTQSSPSWEHIVEQAGWPSADDPDDPQVLVRPYEGVLDRLEQGQEYAFRLTANPTQATKRPEKLTADQRARAQDGTLPRSVRVGHRTVEQQMGWLIRRSADWGFVIPAASSSEAMGEAVPDVRVTARERRSFRRGGSARVVLQVVTFEGRLTVADVARFRVALVEGMGPAKAYGCGLLTLAPLGSDGGTE